MNIQVSSRHKVEKTMYDMPHVIISVTERNTFADLPKNKQRLGVLQLKFYDIDHKISNYNMFDHYQAREIIEFVEKYKDKVDIIVCQCEAGISRSAGIAAALSKYYNATDDFFFKNYCPNKLVYRILLQELMLKG